MPTWDDICKDKHLATHGYMSRGSMNALQRSSTTEKPVSHGHYRLKVEDSISFPRLFLSLCEKVYVLVYFKKCKTSNLM